MKVLVISQVVFSMTNNTGKTLSSYFFGFNPNSLAQYYFHSEIPTDNICWNYYRFTDVEALKSIINRKITGKSFGKNEIRNDVKNARTDSGIKRKVYIAGSKHTPITLLARDLIWKISNWNNKALDQWIKMFNPDVIFFLSGDGAFTYEICKTISDKYDIPFIPVCVDDYYINNRNHGKFLSGIQHCLFMRKVRKCFDKAPFILTICDKMKDEYSRLFKKECYTLHTAAENRTIKFDPNPSQISYIGNVGYKRYEQLIEMGKAIHDLDLPDLPKAIDIYTGTINDEYIKPLKHAKGINFHGEISSEEVLQVMAKSVAVIHTESFDPEFMNLTKYSVSTKIAETLMYGPCLIAYGPSGIASMDYLKDYNAAFVITRREDLKNGLREILTNADLREQLVVNARKLGIANHDKNVNPKRVKQWLQTAVNGSRKNS